MSMLELMKERYSVRDFDARPVEEDKLQAVLEAARIAPTACNNQPHRIIVVKSEGALAKVRSIARCAFNAPVILILAGVAEESWQNPFTGARSLETDVTIAATQMMLEAQAQGLGSLWVGYADPAKLKAELELPEELTIYGFLDIGYPAPDCKPAPLHSQRRVMEDMVTVL